MSYFPVGKRVTGGDSDDFDDCDPTHYAGGYDIDLTYGRSLPPSYETCYPYRSSAPQFASHSKPSAYATEAPGNEYNSFSGPKSRPGPPASAGGRGYSGPKPNYGFQPGGGVSEYGGRNEYARPVPGYGSGYSMNPASSNFGPSRGRNSEYENPSLIPGRKPDYGESGYGTGARNPASDFGGSGYGGWPEKPTYPKSSYPEPSYPRPYPGPSFPMPSYPEPLPSYPDPGYPDPSYPDPSYPMPSYPAPGYGLQKYEHDNSDYERRKHDDSHRHGRRH